MNVTAILITPVIGVIAGGLAHMIAGGRGSLIGTVCLGLIGSFIGGLITYFFYIGLSGIIGQVVVSTVGALLLLTASNVLFRRTA